MKAINSLLIVFFLVMTIDTYSQCVKKVDEFTNQVIIENKLVKLGKQSFLRPYFIKAAIASIDDNYVIKIKAEGPNIQTIRIDDIIYFKFSDDSVITIKNITTNIAKPESGGPFSQGSKTTIWTNSLVLLIPQKDVESFNTKEIFKIRCGRNDYTVKENRSNVFIDQITCIKNLK